VLGGTPSVLTIHNLAYQGLFEPDWLPRLDLAWDQLAVDRMEYWGRISLLKGGINDARAITTVSRRYAEEIQTPEFGCGFDGILRERSEDLVGILNGIDAHEWDPAHDRFLPQPFDADNLAGKRAAKAAILARYGLRVDAPALERPLIGMVSRMVDQKGFDLLLALADVLPSLDAAFVVLGTGDAKYQTMWRTLAAAHPDRIGARIGFDEALAHLIEAGADLFLMPSKFEPCGLNQMYSMRYGTVPIVHDVGGLHDTVSRKTGFVFGDYTSDALLATLRQALAACGNRPAFRAIQAAGMRLDFSWDRSAKEYVKIYENLGPGGPRGRNDGR
jgi:starch synthase